MERFEGEGEEEAITEEQRQRAEANRAAALAKRKALLSLAGQPTEKNDWRLSKCRKISPEPTTSFPISKPPEKFLTRLEICAADSFSVTPAPIEGFTFPGEEFCFQKIRDCLSNVILSHYTQNTSGGKACVYKLEDYHSVLKSLKNSKCIKCEEIPWATLNVIERLSHSITAREWIPCRPEHLPDEKVDELIAELPKKLLNTLLPFQLDGIRFGLRRGGWCLIADEMGLGKTIQAITIAGCFMKEGAILVVCPAILRYSWAEELEHWFPFCLPSDIHLVFGHKDNPARLPKFPRVVVTSYTMLRRLKSCMLEQEWVTLIVDESHHLHCTKKSSEKDELEAVRGLARKVKHLILLSGTPSLSRYSFTIALFLGDNRPFDIFHQVDMLWPGLLGPGKFEFANTYCDVTSVRGSQGKVFQDFSKGTRLEELNVLLKQSVMIRRLKENVLPELPPKRRQIINLVLKRSDINAAMATLGLEHSDALEDSDDENVPLDIFDEDKDCDIKRKMLKRLSALGLAKLPGFIEWLSIHPIMAEVDREETRESSSSHKMIIFSYHHKVLDGVQAFLCEKRVEFVRIDCNVTGRDRQSAVQSFQSSKEVRIALIGIRSGGSGLNLTAADIVVFLELPLRPADIQQGEDRAHRHGQTKLVNIYIFCAKDTVDELHWQRLNKSLLRVSSTVNGKHDAIQEIEVESIAYLEKCANATDKSKKLETLLLRYDDSPAARLKRYHVFCIDPESRPVRTSCNSDVELNKGDGESDNNVVSYSRSNIHIEVDKMEKHADLRHDEFAAAAEPDTIVHSYYFEGSNDHQCERIKVDTACPETTLVGSGSVDEVEVGNHNPILDTLRFEVSRYTGRIHLYSCFPGRDSRPRPLFENFRPEEVECLSIPEESDKMTDESNLHYKEAVMSFIRDWKQLRPIERKKLTGKPLRLPLSYELCFLNESLNHDNLGLLRGGSKRRKTPKDEISHPLPRNFASRKVNLNGDYGRKEIVYSQAWSDMDEPLCKLCQTPCKKHTAKTPQFFEDLFCSLDCCEEYRSRTSNRFLRQELFKIEKGICTICRLDCHKLVEHIKPLSVEQRKIYVQRKAPNIAKGNKLLHKLVNEPMEGNAWHADHIVAVYRGGGECKLENMRTLCVACHTDVTRAQCAERHLARKKEKQRLREIMNGLEKINKCRQIDRPEDCDLDPQQNAAVDDLLIEVPGSAYSGTNVCKSREINQEHVTTA